MNKWLCAIVFALAAAGVQADTTWTGKGTDHKWSNADNWSNGVPKGGQGEDTYFPEGNWEVEIDDAAAEHPYYTVRIQSGTGTVKMTGNGYLNFPSGADSSCRFFLFAGRELIVDGPQIRARDLDIYGRVTLRSGTLRETSKGTTLYDGGAVVIAGGTFAPRSLAMTNGVSSLRLKNGTFAMAGSLYLDNGNAPSFEGGNVVESEPVSSTKISLLLPPRHVTLDVTDNSNEALNFGTPGDYSFSGTVTVTNAGAAYLYSYQNTTDIMHLNGRGTLYADKLRHTSSKTGAKIECDLAGVCLGAGGIVAGTHAGTLRFLNGPRIGAYADWTVTGTYADSSLYAFGGPCVFDTQDPFAAATAHTIAIPNASIALATAFRATGGGAVRLGLSASMEEALLDTLAVEGQTTLAFSAVADSARRISVRRLSVAEGSTLEISPAKGIALDVAENFSAAAGAIKLAFDDSTFATNRRLVATWPVGTEPDLSVFDATGLPAGLTLAKTLNVAYLTDGTSVGADRSSETSVRYWTGGAGDGLLATAGNWSTGTALDNDKTPIVYFDGWRTADISMGTSSFRVNSLNFLSDCGPIRISSTGSSNYIRSGGTTDISSSSDCPVVLDCVVSPNKGGNFIVEAKGRGAVSLLRSIPSSGTARIAGDFGFCGDVRFGGTCNGATNIYATATESANANCFTLLSGASLTTINQTKTIANACAFAVCDNAALTINGTQLAFSTANQHLVDGTWTIACPLAATAKQSFRGTGTVKIAALAEAAGGLELTGSIVCAPGTWDAATPVVCRGTPTLKPEVAASIALGEEGVVEVVPDATLAIDTACADLTLNSPVKGGGSLTKKGTGRLVLGCTDTVVDTLTIEAGSLDLSPALRARAEHEYVPLFTARTVVGNLGLPANLRLVATDNGNATATYAVKAQKCLTIIVR